jgi:hypothetical protein
VNADAPPTITVLFQASLGCVPAVGAVGGVSTGVGADAGGAGEVGVEGDGAAGEVDAGVAGEAAVEGVEAEGDGAAGAGTGTLCAQAALGVTRSAKNAPQNRASPSEAEGGARSRTLVRRRPPPSGSRRDRAVMGCVLEFGMDSGTQDVYGPAVGVVGGIPDVLVVE